MKKLLVLFVVVMVGLVSCKKDEVVTPPAVPEFAITATANANGSISPTGITKVKQGDSVRYTITPNAGAVVDSVVVDGKSAGKVTTYTFKNVTAAHTIDAKFSSSYDNADAINGGMLYDKFWATETKYVNGSAEISHLNRFADFYRCKQCHAWDLLGNTGSYINRAPKTSRPNVAGALLSFKIKTAMEVFTAIKTGTVTRRKISDSVGVTAYNPTSNKTVGDQMPDYSTLLTDAQIWDIVKFIKEGALDVTLLYDATYTGTYPTGSATYSNIGKDGIAATGKTFYTANCFSCHGSDGKSIPDLDHTPGLFVGKFVRTKPNEAQHKAKFGTLGSAMKSIPSITLTNVKDLYKALADTVAFPN